MSFPRVRILNISNINRSLSVLCERIEELEKRVAVLTGEPCDYATSGTSDESAQTIVAPKPIAETVADEPTLSDESQDTEADEVGIDWREMTDVSELKEYALETYGIEIKGNKKAETVVAEIEAHIANKED